MEDLRIEPTKYTPLIFFDGGNNAMEIKGVSYPPDITEFFDPFFDWMNRFFKQTPGNFLLNIELTYVNSSSSRALWKLFDMLENEAENGTNITVNWIYDEDDDDKLEMGEEFGEDLESVTFNLKSKDA